MMDELRAIGDALEQAIERDLDQLRHEPGVSRHDIDEHTNRPQEAFVLITSPTPDSTSERPTADGPQGPARGRSRRAKRRLVALASLATLAIGGAAAATAISLSSDDVSHGLPGGSAIFEGTDPSCTSTADSNTFTCTLAHAPTVEVLSDYTGTLETFIDSTSHVAGGCIGDTADGLHWTCYAGQLAVDKGIIGPDLLGLLQVGPSHG